MRKFITSFLKRLLKKFDDSEPMLIPQEMMEASQNKLQANRNKPKKREKNKNSDIVPYKENPARDLIEMMEVPFLALSKNRRNPIIYESPDGTRKVKVTRHTGHFLASIYDWDIILFVASKMQKILNFGEDIPPRTMIIRRHELLKEIHKHNVNTQQKRLESSLHRLRRTAIDTTIRNEDYRYKADFGFIDSWDYTERKDVKEIRITLSQWLYDGICAQGALLKIDSEYFKLTSGVKKFLYRTARKHVGNREEPLEFSIEKLYEKSGSEREFKKFKGDLKVAVMDNDIPEYTMKWIQRNKRCFVVFSRSNIEKIEQILEKFEPSSIEEMKENEVNISRTLGEYITDFDNPVHKI